MLLLLRAASAEGASVDPWGGSLPEKLLIADIGVTLGVPLRLDRRGDSLHGIVVPLHDFNSACRWVPALCGLMLCQKLSIAVQELISHIFHRFYLAVALNNGRVAARLL